MTGIRSVSAEAASGARPVIAKRPANNRAKITNDPRRGFDGRTPGGRRRLDLLEELVMAAGGWNAVSNLWLADARRVVELTGLCEEARSAALKGGAVDLIGLSRLEGVADRARRRLALPAAAGPKATGADVVQAYLRQRAAERAGAQSGAPASAAAPTSTAAPVAAPTSGRGAVK